MIEASVLSPGPWNSDFILAKDAAVEFFRCQTDIGVGLNMTTEEMRSYHSVNGSSHSPSTASSECDDDFSIDVCSDDHNMFLWNDNDYLNTALSDVLVDNLSDRIALPSLDWSMSEDLPVTSISEAGSDVIPSIPSSPQPTRTRNKVLDPFTSKSWSRMNMSEQVEVVEALTQVISSELGLREQLDVIRLIDPSAVVSTNDTEFVIDLNCLTDSKWQCVREYVKKARKNRNQVGEKTSVSTSKASSCHKSQESGNSMHVQNISSNNTNLINSKVKQSKKDNKEHKVQAKAWKQRQKKEYRQMMKERRSGLFVKEEVLALSVCPPPEEEDIDILD